MKQNKILSQNQMKSSQQGNPQNMSYTYPAMSEQMYEMMQRVTDLPAFFLIIYIDEAGTLQWWGAIRSEFPKDRLKEGLDLLRANGLSEEMAIAEEMTLPPDMTADMFNKLCEIRTRPAYFGIIYMDSDELKTWAEMRDDSSFTHKLYPIDLDTGIARAEHRFVTGWIEHYKPGTERDNPLLEKLRTMMAKEKA